MMLHSVHNNGKRRYTARHAIAMLMLASMLISMVAPGLAADVDEDVQESVELVLDCQYQVHEHTEGCYSEDEAGASRLTCGYADYVLHIHSDDCFDADGELVCPLPEVFPHTHKADCYESVETLNCGLTETAGHVHTDDCRTRVQGDLICEKEEHTHTEECSAHKDELICELEEHTHTEDCYIWHDELTCKMKEGEGRHAHSEDCYISEDHLICQELMPHGHNDGCYSQNRDGEPVLTCGKLALEKHIHGEACFVVVENDEAEAEVDEEKEEEEEAEDEDIMSFANDVDISPLADDPQILVNNIVLGNKEYAGGDYDGLSKDIATRMKTGNSSPNSGANRYVVYIGKTLDLGALTDEDDRYSFKSSNPGILSPGDGKRDGNQWTTQFKAIGRGECYVELIDKTTGSAVDTFYVDVRYPIYIETSMGEYNKNAVHEFLVIYSWLQGSNPDLLITDPDGRPLYIKNANLITYSPYPDYHDDLRYMIRSGDTLILSTYTQPGGPNAFSVSPGDLQIISQKVETVGGLQKVTLTLQGGVSNDRYTITFGDEEFYLKVNNGGGGDHFDIEVADGATCTVNEVHVQIAEDGEITNSAEKREYDAEINDVKGSTVYDSAGSPLCTLESWEYWNQNNSDATQHEYTSAYWTNEQRQLIHGPGGRPYTAEEEARVRNGETFADLKSRGAMYSIDYSKIAQVVFNIDVDLYSGGSVFRTVPGLLIPLKKQDIIDAYNKCPNHSGLDFSVQLQMGMVDIELTGGKYITGRPWIDAVDDGAYSFILTPVNNAPMPSGTSGSCTVQNDGHSIKFPDIEFWVSGTYKYKVTEMDPAAGSPGYVKKDTSEITITLEIDLDADDPDDVVKVSYEGGSGGLVFINEYDHEPEKTEPDPGPDELVRVGESVDYKITWHNYSDDGATVTVTDRLDPGVDFVSAKFGPVELTGSGTKTGEDDHGKITITYNAATHTVKWVVANRNHDEEGFVELTVEVNSDARYDWDYSGKADGPANVDDTTKDYEIHNQAKIQINNDDEFYTDVIDNPVTDPHKREVNPGDGVPVRPEQNITYAIDWQNYKDYGTTVTIVDKLDENVAFVSADYDGKYDSQKHTVTWTLADREAKTDGTVTVTVRVLESALTPGKVVNTATVQVDQDPEQKLEEPSNPVTDFHKTETKPGADQLVRVGEAVDYEVSWRNYKSEPATVTVSDRLDPGVDFVSAKFGTVVLTGGGTKTGNDADGKITISYNPKTHTVTWVLEGRLPDAKGEVALTVKVNPNAFYDWDYNNKADGPANVDSRTKDYEIHNQAKVKIDNDPDIYTDVIDNPVNDPHKREVDPGNGVPVQTGQEITYAIEWQNYKDHAATVTIVDTLDKNVKFISADNGGKYDSAAHTVTWTLTNRGAKTNGTVTVTVKVLDSALTPGKVVNTATVQVDQDPEQKLEEPSNPVTDFHKTEAKPGAGNTVNVGDVISYEITWHNYKSAAAKVVVTDPLDNGLDFVSASNGGTYDAATRTVTWNLGSQPSGASGKLTLVAKVNGKAVSAGSVNNQASMQVDNDPKMVSETPQNPVKRSGVPATGDPTNLGIWIAVMYASVAGLGIAFIPWKRKKKITD